MADSGADHDSDRDFGETEWQIRKAHTALLSSL